MQAANAPTPGTTSPSDSRAAPISDVTVTSAPARRSARSADPRLPDPHRRSLLRNLVTSVIVEERIETTVPKAKAARPLVEKMITLGKRGDLAARRQAGSYLMTDEAVVKLFDTVGPRFGDRNGGYTRIIRTGWNKGDGADKAFLELLGSEKILDEKKEKRAEARAKKAAEAKKAMEEAEAQAQAEGAAAPAESGDKDEKKE